MRLDNHSDELSPGRLFIHARLNDPMTGGPLYCRIRGVEGDLVEYEEIYHWENGSERIGAPWRGPIGGFIEGDLRRLVRGQVAAASAGTSAS